MSATVNISSSLSRSGLCTTSAKSRMVRASEMSRLKAMALISRWCSTSQATVSVSAALMPKRGQSVRAIWAPTFEWSSVRPLAMSCRKVAT